MADKKLIFSNHAVQQMFQRGISVEDVKFVLLNGILVNNYPDDKPLPSKLLFADCNNRSIHVVCSENIFENEPNMTKSAIFDTQGDDIILSWSYI